MVYDASMTDNAILSLFAAQIVGFSVSQAHTDTTSHTTQNFMTFSPQAFVMTFDQ